MLNETDLSRADLNLLVLFEVVLQEGHVGRAADRLKLSPSAISHGLARLRRLLQDPLFLRTPKGVVPSARAAELAEPVAEILARVRNVIATAAPFSAAESTRRFTIGAPDGVSAVLVSPLLATLQHVAPRIDLGVRQLLPAEGSRSATRAWEPALADLESGAIDVAVVPFEAFPVRFAARPLYEEDFVIAMRKGHPFANDPSLDRFCASRHLLVSHSGDPSGFVDDALAARGRSRRIAMTVPSFMMALAVLAETDLVTALPRRLVTMYAARFDVTVAEAPLPLPRFRLCAIAPKVAMMDQGVSWLVGLLEEVSSAGDDRSGGRGKDVRRRSSRRLPPPHPRGRSR